MYTFKQIRKLENLTQQQMADRLGLNSQAYVSNIESGDRIISRALAYRVMNEFNVVAYLDKGCGEWRFTPIDGFL